MMEQLKRQSDTTKDFDKSIGKSALYKLLIASSEGVRATTIAFFETAGINLKFEKCDKPIGVFYESSHEPNWH